MPFLPPKMKNTDYINGFFFALPLAVVWIEKRSSYLRSSAMRLLILKSTTACLTFNISRSALSRGRKKKIADFCFSE